MCNPTHPISSQGIGAEAARRPDYIRRGRHLQVQRPSFGFRGSAARVPRYAGAHPSSLLSALLALLAPLFRVRAQASELVPAPRPPRRDDRAGGRPASTGLAARCSGLKLSEEAYRSAFRLRGLGRPAVADSGCLQVPASGFPKDTSIAPGAAPRVGFGSGRVSPRCLTLHAGVEQRRGGKPVRTVFLPRDAAGNRGSGRGPADVEHVQVVWHR
jgi:hypothetical protein